MLKHFLISLVVMFVIGYSQPASMQDVSPLPDNLQTITASNAGQLQQINQLGQGTVVETGWSPDSQRFAVVTTAGVALYDTPNFDQQTVFIPGYTRLSRFSPDWSKVVISTADMKTQLWDLATMTALDLTEKIADPIPQDANMAFTPDGKLLMLQAQAANYSQSAVLWDLEHQQLYGHWEALKEQALDGGIQVSPGGKWLGARSYGAMTAIWDVEHKRPLNNLQSGVYAFSHNDQFITWVTSKYPNIQSVHLGRLPDETDDVVIPIADGLFVFQLLFTPDDHELVIYLRDGRGNGTLKIWNIKQHQMRVTSTFPIGITLSGFSPDGRYLFSTDYNTDSITWDMETGQPLETPWRSLRLYSPNGKYVIAQSSLWLADFKPDDKPLQPLSGDGYRYIFSLDSHWLASVYGSSVYLYDLTPAIFPVEPSITLSEYILYNGTIYSPDGSLLLTNNQLLDGQTLEPLTQINGISSASSFIADQQGHLWLGGEYHSGSNNPEPAVWEITPDQPITVSEPRTFNSILSDQFYANPIAISPDVAYLAVGYGDDLSPTPTIQIWNLTRNTQPIVVYGHQEQINDLAFSPDGHLLASASGYTREYQNGIDDTVRLWRINRGQTTTLTEIARFYTDGQADHITFSPDGRLIAATAFGGKFYVWDTVTGKELVSHDDKFNLPTFSPDGGLLAVSDWDGAIHLFDTQSWKEISVIYGHIGHLTSLQFRPDGHILASSGSDGTVRFWGIQD